MQLKKISRLFLAVIFSAITLSAFADKVPVKEAQKVATHFYLKHYTNHLQSTTGEDYTHVTATDIQFQSVEIIREAGHSIAYVFNRPGDNGYIAIAADDRAFPVLNYAFEGNFNPDAENLPEGLEWFWEGYSRQIVRAIEQELEPFDRTTRAWKTYSSSEIKSQIKSQSPMTDSIAWGQGCYYNALCPADNNSSLCNRAPVGCVATAMGIVMKFHAYPKHGFGSETYNSNYGQLSANFGNSTYDWDNMPNSLDNHNVEVAKISYQAGVAVNMDYGPNGSGAIFGHSYYTPTAETALKNHFGFPNANWHPKSNFTTSNWANKLRENIDSLNPVLYAGGVHAFVADGYQGSSNNYFHFNWGWGGMYNSYCYLDDIVPGGTGTGGGQGNYTSNQQAIFDVAPPELPPQADFTASATTISPGGSVFFKDMTDYQPDTWHWDFGDGDTSNQQLPLHTYTSTGTYNVKLIVSNSHGADSIVKNNLITVQQGSNINADFIKDTDTAYVTDMVTFSDSSSGNPNAWTWDFGDGNYDNVEDPQHAYSSAGTYTVSLTAANSSGSDTTSSDIVVLPAPVPDAAFEADTIAVAEGTNAKFYDLSTNQPNSWEWSFGDGSTSSQQNPSHTYQVAGDYTVQLKISNKYGMDSITKQNYINVYQAVPEAGFTVSKTSALDGESIQFVDQSKGVVNSYLWDFGDGNTSSDRYPTHSYDSPGTYTVSLQVSNSSGSDTEEKTDLITVSGTGIDEQQDINFSVYPNPAKRILNLKFVNPADVVAVRLIDISGKIILRKEKPAKEESISVQSLNSGIYILEVIGETDVNKEKIIIH